MQMENMNLIIWHKTGNPSIFKKMQLELNKTISFSISIEMEEYAARARKVSGTLSHGSWGKFEIAYYTFYRIVST